MELLHEIQAANLLGFQTAAQFRAAVARGDVPGPARKIGRCPVWSRPVLMAWLDGRAEREPTEDEVLAEIEAL